MVYFTQNEDKNIKIGYTKNAFTFKFRLSNLEYSTSQALKVLSTIPGGPHLEKALHRKFSSHRIQGEWFSPSPELLKFIKNPYCEKLKIQNSNEKGNSINNNKCKWCGYKWYGYAKWQKTCPGV